MCFIFLMFLCLLYKETSVKWQKQRCFQRKNSNNFYIPKDFCSYGGFFNSFTGNISFFGLCKAIVQYQLTGITLGKSHVLLQLLSSSGLKFCALSIKEKETKNLILLLVKACILSNVLILNIWIRPLNTIFPAPSYLQIQTLGSHAPSACIPDPVGKL